MTLIHLARFAVRTVIYVIDARVFCYVDANESYSHQRAIMLEAIVTSNMQLTAMFSLTLMRMNHTSIREPKSRTYCSTWDYLCSHLITNTFACLGKQALLTLIPFGRFAVRTHKYAFDDLTFSYTNFSSSCDSNIHRTLNNHSSTLQKQSPTSSVLWETHCQL